MMAAVKDEKPPVAQQNNKPWTLREVGGKTVWEWLHLLSALAIPVVLAVVGFWFTAQQDTRQQRIEDQRAEAERELAEERAQDEALQSYLDQMGALLLEKDLRNSEEDSEVRTLARARTLTVLENLDGDGRGSVLQFLFEAELIGRSKGDPQASSPEEWEKYEQQLEEYREYKEVEAEHEKLREEINVGTSGECYSPDLPELQQVVEEGAPPPSPEDVEKLGDLGMKLGKLRLGLFDNSESPEVMPPHPPGEIHIQPAISLDNATLAYAELPGALLAGADLERVDFHGANLNGAQLFGTILNQAVLDEATFDGAVFHNAQMRMVQLNDAEIRRASVRGVPLTEAELSGADLSHSDGRDANLTRATLSNADLSDTWLSGADLSCANLRNANLENANLSSFGTLGGATSPSEAEVTMPQNSETSSLGPPDGEITAVHDGETVSRTDLSQTGADLSGADLAGADLAGADLRGANLRNANVTQDQLEQAASLEDATMPNGQKYEDWLKSREEDGG
jgi:uncharacterized protein YjbI with pentapeptide repeats